MDKRVRVTRLVLEHIERADMTVPNILAAIAVAGILLSMLVPDRHFLEVDCVLYLPRRIGRTVAARHVVGEDRPQTCPASLFSPHHQTRPPQSQSAPQTPKSRFQPSPLERLSLQNP